MIPGASSVEGIYLSRVLFCATSVGLLPVSDPLDADHLRVDQLCR